VSDYTEPTDDEREALHRLEIPIAVLPGREHRGYYTLGPEAVDAILEIGFRLQGAITDEWEYAVRVRAFGLIPTHSEGEARHKLGDLRYRGGEVVRRRKAGPWEPFEAARDA
jgi:hypothetical protein